MMHQSKFTSGACHKLSPRSTGFCRPSPTPDRPRRLFLCKANILSLAGVSPCQGSSTTALLSGSHENFGVVNGAH